MIYLDYAATSALRPPEVADAVAGYLRDVGATPGRAGHARAVEAGRVLFRCRRALAELLNLPGDPGRLVFQLNATHALNTALFGLLRPGERVVRTPYDHNAVRRPLAALASRGVRTTTIQGSPAGTVDLDELDAALAGDGEPARLLVLPHASNVLGQRLPVRAMAERAHARGALVLLDAAQTVGHLRVDALALGVDLLAFAGHKGLLGPQGTGALWVRPGLQLEPLLFGGTGGDSEALRMPDELPDRLEAGTQNGPGIAGLLAGVQWVQRRGVDALHARALAHKRRLRERLSALPGLRVLSPPGEDGVGIVTVAAERIPASELALRLERRAGVLARAGLHCAPDAHRLLGTLETGALRLSSGWATVDEEIEAAADALAAVLDTREQPT